MKATAKQIQSYAEAYADAVLQARLTGEPYTVYLVEAGDRYAAAQVHPGPAVDDFPVWINADHINTLDLPAATDPAAATFDPTALRQDIVREAIASGHAASMANVILRDDY